MKSIKYLFTTITLFALTANMALAVQLNNPLDLSQGSGGSSLTFEAVISRIITSALGISGVLALVAFVYGGIIWMVSGGDAGKVTKGKNVMIWAVFGLVIIFSSYAILNFVFNALLGGTGPNPAQDL